MAEPNKTNKERLKDITDGIEQGIKDLFGSDRYAQYLGTLSRFHRYSVNNQMLIFMQKPDATLVTGYNKWRDQFERHVIKGEKGIQIIAPTPFKKMMEMQKIDPDTGAPVLDADGKAVTEEKEVQIPMFKPVTVFDVSQTDGKPLPSLAADLTGNVQRYNFFVEALRRSSPVPVHMETMTATMDGYFDLDRQDIAIRKGMSEVQTVVATVHEITHAKLHNYEQERLTAPVKEGAEPPKPKDRRTEEVEAESVAYAVCQYYGIQTGENSFGYIASWSKDKELPELRASLETINKTASGLISDIDHHYREVVKEYDVVIEVWAADYADYIIDNSGDSLLLSTRDELIAEAMEDIKSGEIRFPKSALLDCSLGSDNSADELLRRLEDIEKLYPQTEHEAMYLLDGETYLHLQTAVDGYDYTFYDKSLRQLDGGIVDSLDISFDDAYAAVMELEHLYPETSEKVSLGILEEIAAVRAQDVEDYKREHNFGQPMSEVEQWEADHIVDFTVTEQTVTPSRMPPPYDVMDFNDAQWSEIKLGWEQNLDISQYAKPDIPAESMAKMRDALARGLIIQTVDEAPPTTDAPPPPEQAYHYPMPDPDYSVKDLEDCGYMDGDMLPLSQYRALELYSKDLTIYTIDGSGAASMVFDSEEIVEHGGLFAVPYEEWEIARAELSPAKETVTEQDFLNAPHDAYAIYQVRHGELYRDYRFESLDKLQSAGLDAQRDNYNFIYSAPLSDSGSTAQKLDNLYHQFNVNHPADYRGHSLSVSDIIALKQDGEVTYHYCDSVGFQQLPGFNAANNPLRSLEDSIEQNDNNLDGIINNLPPPAVYRDSFAHSSEHNEMDKYHADRQLSFECRDAIDAAIRESRYDTHYYKLKDAAEQVIDTYGAERVELIMAKIVQASDWDGRYSRQNKEWAKGFEIPQGMKDIYSDTHPCLLDGFLEKVREKPSILKKLEQAAPPQTHKKTAFKKSAEMEL
ncbi:DUF3849 domain-containing protein [Christensenellaceae bacterium OttesenSCG-928-M15]|nr:DUF3849 domain-containing protein [Christensenellaceae bacterium OttesenSCG-928-M15]